MKQNRKPVSKPVVKEVPIPSTKPLTEGLDQLFEVMQLLECQSDALSGAAELYDNCKHLPYLNLCISEKLQTAYESIHQFWSDIHPIVYGTKGGR